MTKLLERAFDGVRQLPEEEQNDLAGFLLAHLPDIEPGTELTQEDRSAIAEADAEIARGDYLDGDELKAFWRKLGA